MKKKVVSIVLSAAMVATMAAGTGMIGEAVPAEGKVEKATVAQVMAAADETEAPENEISGDASADDAFVVWGWNADIQNILDNLYATDKADNYKRIVFVNTGGSDYYQGKLDEILEDPSNELYPDLIGLEVDYVQKYVQSGMLQSMKAIGIDAAEYADQYEYDKTLGTNQEDGEQYAMFWQATPGCWQLRADLCEKYLGTTDPVELQKLFATWDDVDATAAKVLEASGGKCKLLSGYDDLYRVYSNSRTTGWYDENDNLSIDPQIETYLNMAKDYFDKDYTYATVQWKENWYANMDGDGESANAALAYTGCPWFTYWCLSDTWKNNTILVEGPQQFYWGGTGLAVTTGCSDTELAADIIRYFTCDSESMKKINATNSDFVNNAKANEEIIAEGTAKCDYIYGDQDYMTFYSDLLSKTNIDTSIVTAEDKVINDMLATYVDEYAQGKADYDTATGDFLSAVHDTFSYLNVQ